MNEKEVRFDKIEYDENWQTVSSQTYAQPYCEESQEEQLHNEEAIKGEIKAKKEKSPKQLVIILQLILCILIFSAFYILKQTGSDFYSEISRWYSESLNNSLISTTVFSDFDINNIGVIFATDDEN